MFRLTLLTLALLLGGCASEPERPKDQPSMIGFSLYAEGDVNPNESSWPSPIALQLVVMAEDSKLLATDYDQVTEDVEKALGKNYLDHQDYTLLPGQFKYLPPVKVSEEARYIGVIAHYADPESAQWRKVIKIQNKGRAYQVLVRLRQDEVELLKEEE
ncbi:type VI secretion system lipoprotein TssJ [Aeromonas cavernicola]|uniref:Type VI secretion system lipoprotein TssJ n=1 Tax=Aeromonas cavernicola TaxID=1006623 RepID=A0A2H9U178_9GAMM|nr:type VI secretion system lipoprotein TssJ [Aeromonas cavernicola]PJG57729.1 type VI secretion system lipoprotein TssJ [Aeromonas cavernicola]